MVLIIVCDTLDQIDILLKTGGEEVAFVSYRGADAELACGSIPSKEA